MSGKRFNGGKSNKNEDDSIDILLRSATLSAEEDINTVQHQHHHHSLETVSFSDESDIGSDYESDESVDVVFRNNKNNIRPAEKRKNRREDSVVQQENNVKVNKLTPEQTRTEEILSDPEKRFEFIEENISKILIALNGERKKSAIASAKVTQLENLVGALQNRIATLQAERTNSVPIAPTPPRASLTPFTSFDSQSQIVRTSVPGLPGLDGRPGNPGRDGNPGKDGRDGRSTRIYEIYHFDLAAAASDRGTSVNNLPSLAMDPKCPRSIVSFSNLGKRKNCVSVDTSSFSFPVINIYMSVSYSHDGKFITFPPEIKKEGEKNYIAKFRIEEGANGMAILSIRFEE